MYIHEETKAGKTVVIRNHYTSRYHKRGLERSENTNLTTKAQEKANERKDIHELTIRMNANFTEDDYHIILTYQKSDRPPTPDEAKRDRRNFLRRMKEAYKENGLELKYIALTGYGVRGAPHHHIVISGNLSPAKMARIWNQGRLHSTPMEDSGEYSKLAAYFASHRKNWKAHDGKGRMWTCSRNLIRPESKKWVVRADRYNKTPRPRKGFYVKKETVHEGITSEGWPYLNYVLVSDPRAPGRKRE